MISKKIWASLVAFLISTNALSVTFDFRDLGMRQQAILRMAGLLQTVEYLNPTPTGTVELDLKSFRSGFTVDLSLDNRFFDSLNLARNLELKEKWLKSAESPELKIRMQGSFKSSQDEIVSGKEVSIRGDAQLIWHNQTRIVPVEGKICYFPKNSVTQERLPGNLLHLILNIKWNRSSFLGDTVTSKSIHSNFGALTLDLMGTDQPPLAKLAGEPDKAKQRN